MVARPKGSEQKWKTRVDHVAGGAGVGVGAEETVSVRGVG